MDPQTLIARRIAQELKPGMLVNLGVGIPTLVANYVPDGIHVFFQSENGLIGTGPVPEQGRCRWLKDSPMPRWPHSVDPAPSLRPVRR